MSTKVLCIPDAHVMPDEDLRRFSALGNFIVREQPDMIVQLGDFLSLSSLSHWDMDNRMKMEGRRFKKDLVAGREAVKRMFQPMKNLRANQWKNKKRVYNPSLIWCDGNHEEWLIRYIEQHPELEGQWDLIEELGVDNYFRFPHFKSVPYKEFIVIDGVCYTHVPINANNQPISGVYMLRRASEIFSIPTVFGHSHRLEVFNRKYWGIADDSSIIENKGCHTFLSCGCFFEEIPEYAKGALNNWWSGIVLLDVDNGKFDFQTVSLKKLLQQYGL